MGTFTISMAIFNSKLFVYLRVSDRLTSRADQHRPSSAAKNKCLTVSVAVCETGSGAEKPLMILWPDDGWINHDQPPISSLPQSDIATSPNQMEVFKGNIIFITVNVSFFGHNNPESALLRTTWSLNLQTQIRVVLDMLCLPAPLLNGRMIPSHRLSSFQVDLIPSNPSPMKFEVASWLNMVTYPLPVNCYIANMDPDPPCYAWVNQFPLSMSMFQ